MHADGGVAEHRFRSRGAEADVLVRARRASEGAGLYRILERPEAALRVPVDEALASVDIAVAEHAEEGLAHRPHADRVEREPRPLPVAGCSELLELLDDPRLVLVLPLPDAFDEFVAAEVAAGFLLLL